MTTPQITVPSSMPDPLQPQPDFDAVFSAALAELLTAFGQTNTVATWMNTTAIAAAASATAASGSATDADTARLAAELAQSTAEGFAKYQGDYDAGTLYAVGESVTYLGGRYVKKSTAAAGTTPVDGADWVVVPGVNIQTFTSSGTWTKPSGATVVLVEAVGAGGGGANQTNTTHVGGGAGGSYVSIRLAADDIGASESVTIGGGGTGGASGSATSGTAGGDTTFGSHVTAKGGNPGTSAAFRAGTLGGATNTTWTSEDWMPSTVLYFGSPGGTSFGTNGPAGTVMGGGGGGGGPTAGGTSQYHGNGGDGSDEAGIKANDGETPGGGGGGSRNDGGGGGGGDGWCRVISW